MELQLLISKNKVMKEKSNHSADIQNPNRGTSGTNIANGQNNGNRGGQLNPNRKG